MKKGLAVLVLALTSCSPVYEQTFDCPPGKGVPCTSVTDLEAMIIETEEGPDVFVGRRWGSESYRKNNHKRVLMNDCSGRYYVDLPCEEIIERGGLDASNP